MHTVKILASKINQANFLLKTTEVTARLFLVVSTMIQEVVHQKPVYPALSSSAFRGHHPASREGEGFGMTLGLLLHNPPGQDAHKGAVFTPCINPPEQ